MVVVTVSPILPLQKLLHRWRFGGIEWRRQVLCVHIVSHKVLGQAIPHSCLRLNLRWAVFIVHIDPKWADHDNVRLYTGSYGVYCFHVSFVMLLPHTVRWIVLSWYVRQYQVFIVTIPFDRGHSYRSKITY